MPRFSLIVCAIWVLLPSMHGLPAADAPKAPQRNDAPATKTVQQLTESARKSVVVITAPGRDGKRQGVGTGFVVAADGLIATNLHVIGEARPISVQLADGNRHEVTAIHAFDRSLDLALIRIDVKDLIPLELGDSEGLKQGQPVVALGNPQGLQHSVVAGVVSSLREIDGRSMIQLAIPIESGNSGGPLLDMQGRVQGILTMKSAVTANLGFAVTINSLKPLLKKPNPILMTRWLSIGALDKDDWQPLFGASWRQRPGRVLVEGAGTGFGGRSLCLSRRPTPPLPFEVAVTVRLNDESGAAGLAFHADGGDTHYGFYPTGGQLRLTRFDGPDVLSWKILSQGKSPHYQPGDWNTLKVRVAKDRILCYINDHLVIESNDTELTEGSVGLAKFRDTKAEFQHFQVAKKLPALRPADNVVARITKSVEGIAPHGPPKAELVDALQPDASASTAVLRERAKLLDLQAAQLRRLAVAVHHKNVQTELVKLLQGKEDEIDLLHAALLVAKMDNAELDVEAYRQEIERMARELKTMLPKDADDRAKLAALNKFLFEERGFHGSRTDYYNRANSYLNDVIDDREGLPITLSVLYLEFGRRVGLKIVGVPLPGHFVVRHVPAKGEGQLIDVYETGQPISREEAEKRVLAITSRPLEEEHLAPAGKRSIITRMLQNLLGVARGEEDAEGMLRYVDTIVAISPDAADERWMRAVLRYQTERRKDALDDVRWLLDHEPEGIDLGRVKELHRLLEREGP